MYIHVVHAIYMLYMRQLLLVAQCCTSKYTKCLQGSACKRCTVAAALQVFVSAAHKNTTNSYCCMLLDYVATWLAATLNCISRLSRTALFAVLTRAAIDLLAPALLLQLR
jgi:hypothetical protein